MSGCKDGEPVLLRSISTNSNTSTTFSQELADFIKNEGGTGIDICSLSSSDDGAVATDINATSEVPEIKNYPGKYCFEVEFSEDVRKRTQDVPAKADCTYSYLLDKIFIKMNVSCRFNFKINKMAPGLQVRLLPVFSSSANLPLPVVRCLHHQNIHDLNHKGHIVRCNSAEAIYEKDTYTGRLSTVIPLQDNIMESAHFVSFACLSTCVGGINRQSLLLCCTLERKQRVIGRRTIGLKISTCPGRERKTEESKLSENRSEISPSLKRGLPISTARTCDPGHPVPKVERPAAEDTGPEFSKGSGLFEITIKVRDPFLAQHAWLQKKMIENADLQSFVSRPSRAPSSSSMMSGRSTPTPSEF